MQFVIIYYLYFYNCIINC